MKLHHLLFGAVMVFSTSQASAANRPAGYVTICNEGKTCAVATTTNVAFGRADKFFYKQLAGSFVCNEATFGGRIGGGVNECSIPKPLTSSSSSSSSTSSSSSSASSSSYGNYTEYFVAPPTDGNYQLCTSVGGMCNFAGTREVVAGARYVVHQGGFYTSLYNRSSSKSFTDGVMCSAANFPNIASANPELLAALRCYIREAPSSGGSTCVSTGTVTVTAPITVPESTIYDGGCKTFTPSANMTGQPVFVLGSHAVIRNVIIGGNGGDGIHAEGFADLDNINWQTVGGKSALYAKGGGYSVSARNITITGDPASTSERFAVLVDKESTGVYLSSCSISHVSTVARLQVDNSMFGNRANITKCKLENIPAGVFRTESVNANAYLADSLIRNVPSICTGFDPTRCAVVNTNPY